MTEPSTAPSDAPPERPVRVCFYVFFPGGGIGMYSVELLRALAVRPDVEAELLCTPDFEWQEGIGVPVRPVLRSISHPVPTVRRFRFLHRQFVNPLRCIAHASRVGADIVHFSNVNHITFPLWYPRLRAAGLRMAITAHDVRRQKSILWRAWEERQLKNVYRAADALFVHSEYQGDELAAYAGVPRDVIHVVPHGPYAYDRPGASRAALRERYGLPADRQVALFFGQIRDEKNLGGFIKAMSRTSPRPHLLVAGRAGDRHRSESYYTDLAARVGVADDVSFIDRYIPDEEVGDLFTAADWTVLPYLNSFTSQSGVLNVAAHYRCPILASSAPVLHETVTRYNIGVACEGDDPTSLAAGVNRMMNEGEGIFEPFFAAYLAQNTWDVNATKTAKVYRDLSCRTKNIEPVHS